MNQRELDKLMNQNIRRHKKADPNFDVKSYKRGWYHVGRVLRSKQ